MKRIERYRKVLRVISCNAVRLTITVLRGIRTCYLGNKKSEIEINMNIPNSKKVALAIGHWQLGIEHLGIRNTMECFA